MFFALDFLLLLAEANVFVSRYVFPELVSSSSSEIR